MSKKLLIGALAGLAGGLAMKAVVKFADPASFGLSTETDARSAHELWRRMGWQSTTNREAARIGAGLHYAFAVASGAGYAAAIDRFPALRSGRGAAFGISLWLLGDELAVSLAGLEDPRSAPAYSHISALAAHMLYGMIVEAAIRIA